MNFYDCHYPICVGHFFESGSPRTIFKIALKVVKIVITKLKN